MATINISSDEEIIYKDFNAGNSVQVRVKVSPTEEREYVKGKTVKVVHGGAEASAKIVSDPLIISSEMEGEDRILSLIVEKFPKEKQNPQ
jgi:hypothetical protein